MIRIIFLLITLVMLITILMLNTNRENFSNQLCSNFSCVNDNCSITNESKFCKDGRKQINNVPNCYYDKVVDPNNVQCVDFCVKTYTWEDGKEDNTGQSIEKQFIEDKKASYFASKCNECIDNYYDRIELLEIDDSS